MFDYANKSRSQTPGETTKLIGIELRCVYDDVLNLAQDPVPQMLKICVRRRSKTATGVLNIVRRLCSKSWADTAPATSFRYPCELAACNGAHQSSSLNLAFTRRATKPRFPFRERGPIRAEHLIRLPMWIRESKPF
jgi:hypothetical protein